MFSNSPGGHKIAQWVSRYISRVVSSCCNRDSWLVDQNALSTSASLAESAGLRIGDLRINGAQVIIAAQHMPGGKEGFTL